MKIIYINSRVHGTKECLVDDEDYDFLNQWKWYLMVGKYTCYATRKYWKDGKYYSIQMHRLLLGLTDPNIRGDHRDHNGLNNQRNNIRNATCSENNKNRTGGGASKYLGVCLRKDKKIVRGELKVYINWAASIKTESGYKALGLFEYSEKGEADAAKAYNEAAIKYHGEFANLNIIPDRVLQVAKTKISMMDISIKFEIPIDRIEIVGYNLETV